MFNNLPKQKPNRELNVIPFIKSNPANVVAATYNYPHKTVDFTDLKRSMVQDYISAITDENNDITEMGLRNLAKQIGLKNFKNLITELELVRAIQAETQDEPCFRADKSHGCQETNCIWRDECQKLVAIWCR